MALHGARSRDSSARNGYNHSRMSVFQHALALPALIILSATACVRMRGKPRWVAGGVAAAACLLISLLFPGHMCDAGEPVRHLLIGSVCVTALVLCVRRPGVAAALALAVGGATLGLAWDYQDLVHRDGLTGNPNPSEARRAARALLQAQTALAEFGKSDAAPYAAGWLDDRAFIVAIPANLPIEDALRVHRRGEVRRYWHSWYTGIFARRSSPCRLWFPGGTISAGSAGLEWQDIDTPKYLILLPSGPLGPALRGPTCCGAAPERNVDLTFS